MQGEKSLRPISPYLSIYKPEITSIFSIIERVTGIVLVFVGFLGVIMIKLEVLLLSNYWYYSLCYLVFKSNIGGIFIGGIILFIILCGVYHIVFGIRYLYWDRVVELVSIEGVNKSTPLLGIIVVLVTIIVWFFIIN